MKKAIKENNIEKVKILIDEGFDLNAMEYQDVNALMYSAIYGNPEITKLLIDAGADINAKDNLHRTALILAAYEGNLEIMQVLIGRTSLMIAVQCNYPNIVKLLIDAGATITTKDINDWTALTYSVHYPNTEIDKMLIGELPINELSND